MKFTAILRATTSLLSLTACSDSTEPANSEPSAKEALASNDNKDLTGTFTAGDKTYTGKVSIQNFEATGQFSVLCQDERDPNDSKLIQFVFKDKASARTTGNKTPEYDQGKDQAVTDASVVFDVKFKNVEESTGIITVNKNGKQP